MDQMQMLISDYNKLPLKSQQATSEALAKALSDDKKDYFSNLNNLLNYLVQINKLAEESIQIAGKEGDHLSDITNENSVQLNFKIADILYAEKCFESPDFLNIAKSFTEFCIEIKYPSPNFDDIYKFLVSLKENTEPEEKIAIAIFISGITETDMKFNQAKCISYVKLDTTVTSIKSDEDDNGSFADCQNLKEIIIPPTVASIGTNSFKDCQSLKHVTIPPSLTEIDYYTFEGCSSLTEITIPSSVKEIQSGAFGQCRSLTKVTFENPSSLTKIGSLAFESCRSLKEFIIPPTVTIIKDMAFAKCSDLASISIPTSVTEIEDSAFQQCTALTKIVIPPSVKSIGKNAFKSCSKLEEITVPASVDIGKIGLSSTVRVKKF